MNAHINFDLGIAAAEIAPGDELPSLQHDFDEINNILAALVGQVESEINEVSPWINFLDHIDPRPTQPSQTLVWTNLAPLNPSQWKPILDLRDLEITALADLIWHPVGLIFKLGLFVIRSRESSYVARVIDVLNQVPTDAV